ncbi:hypothetical protein MUK42_03970 [Musa troglodytarum]|uniref:Secreted protein n=1 Tax=Musa troglodytarum TaxID=320322 RepID=A0A9E7FA79_9LILI|nr:hypothetical protein MUK42_03970 [Musa troglodytarum]
MSTSWLCLFVFIFVQGKASGYDIYKRDASVLLPRYNVWFEICAKSYRHHYCLLDTLVGFRRISGKSSINFSFFEVAC